MKHSDVGPLWQHACDQATHEVQAQEIFAALVLEKAADVIRDECLSGNQAENELRAMSAALQSGDRV